RQAVIAPSPAMREREIMSDRVAAALAGPDAQCFLDREDEDLAIADLVGLGGLLDRFDRARHQRIVEDDFDLHFGQKIDDVLGAAIDFGVALLPPKAPDLADGHAGDADLM